MSKHLYKARIAGSSRWVVGNYFNTLDGSAMIRMLGTQDDVLVDDDTVSEYTGLKRKSDGMMIWENDVFQYGTGHDRGNGVVRYGKYQNPWNSGGTHIGFYVDWQDDFHKNVLRKDLPFWIDRAELIGNRFDLNIEVKDQEEDCEGFHF